MCCKQQMLKIIIIFLTSFLAFNVEAKSLEACASQSIDFVEKFYNDINFGKNIEKIVTRYYGDEIKNNEEFYTYTIYEFMGMKYELFLIDEIAVFECRNNLKFMVKYSAEEDYIFFRFFTVSFEGLIIDLRSIFTPHDLVYEANLYSKKVIGGKYEIFKPKSLVLPEIIRSCIKSERQKNLESTFLELVEICEKEFQLE